MHDMYIMMVRTSESSHVILMTSWVPYVQFYAREGSRDE